MPWLNKVTPFISILGALVAAAVTLFSLWFQRRQEKLAVTRAVLAEVSRLLAILPRHRAWWEDCRAKGDTDLPLIAFSTDVYDKLSDRLGHLPPHIIATVVNFYGFVKFLNSIQQTRVQYSQAEKLNDFAEFYAAELAAVATEFRPLLADAFSKYRVLAPEQQPIVGSA
ncbi:MAG: hypothetical protein QOF89_4492 [Acidobacteriota bacterium]|jgi:hypothetical protein|nr:hypothetical protein [Acidobacteriota bacterium]